jgi:enediyne biosynthesis protein E4
MSKKISKLEKIKQTDIDAGDEQDQQNDAVIGRALWASLGVIAGVGLVVGAGIWVYVLTRPKQVEVVTTVAPATKREAVKVTLPKIPLVNISEQAGVDFVHFTGKEGQRLLPETMGGGGGFFDYDSDGDQDILLVNGAPWSWAREMPEKMPTMHLYQNDGTGKFTDVSAQVGLDKSFYGMAPAFGDYDNDGWVDVYITAVGKNHLYRNNQGVFEDVTEAMGVGGNEEDWNCPALWFDYDRDGKLDLMVGKYVQWSRDIDLKQGFTTTGVGRAYGQPTNFAGTFLQLYHNNGDRFEDVSEKAGVMIRNASTGVPSSKTLGLAMADPNHDGWPDVMVANDTVQNYLLINKNDGTFVDVGVQSGVALDRFGIATGAMGVDCAYYRNDDNLAIAIGNFANEPSSFYVSRGRTSQFFDRATATGFGPQTLLRLTFGMMFADMDLDGRQDLLCTNGHLEEEISKIQPTQQYEQSSQLFWNAGPKTPTELIELTENEVGKEFLKPMVGRGSAFADIDGDGDIDLLMLANGGKARLFRNDQTTGHHWLRVKLVGKKDNRDAIGAEVAVRLGTQVLRRTVTPCRSYISQSELPVTFGFGTASNVAEIEITWPNGTSQKVPVDKVDQTITVTQSE